MKRIKAGKVFEVSACDVVVKGEVIEMPDSGDPCDFICQECLRDTEKTVVAEVIQYGVIDDIHWLNVRCDACHKLHVTIFTLEHWAYGAIE